MRRIGYPYEAVVYLKGRGTNKPSTTGGQFCTLGWYLSSKDETYALVASDSVNRSQPWLKVFRVQVR